MSGLMRNENKEANNTNLNCEYGEVDILSTKVKNDLISNKMKMSSIITQHQSRSVKGNSRRHEETVKKLLYGEIMKHNPGSAYSDASLAN